MIVGDTVVVTSKDVPEPVGVQYAHSAAPMNANLYNKAGLPATPFAAVDGKLIFEEDDAAKAARLLGVKLDEVSIAGPRAAVTDALAPLFEGFAPDLTEENIQFIDVREVLELPKIKDLPITYIPLSRLEKSLDQIHTTKKKVLFCQSGKRSKKAVSVLQELGVKNCFSVNEGASEIKNKLKKQWYKKGHPLLGALKKY